MDELNIFYISAGLCFVGFLWMFISIFRSFFPKKRYTLPAPAFSGTVTLPSTGQYAIAITIPLRSGIGADLPGAGFYTADFTIKASGAHLSIPLQRKGSLGAYIHNKDFSGNKMHILGLFNGNRRPGNYDIICTNPGVINTNYKVEVVSYIPVGKRLLHMLPGGVLLLAGILTLMTQVI
ncbi:hypothetical protein EYW98_07495 [Escherichia coli]|uniref:hypothetical protein n=1 Tax=Escherichia sp. MOD1-EC7003 TaxID=2093900 RepID=UPI000CF78DB7|nr:hypothetical protein [Escherichia sp. MOD1-EC7003]EGO8359342.1 hypothetical protein [Escherichia coli]EGO8376676.1 hypothetical protein [Escherichia coli]MCH0693626.1 hypothetical protein [Escherichia coli]